MKKSLFAVLAVVIATTAVNAQPRFGVIADQGVYLGGDPVTGGIGAYITDDMYSAKLTYSSNESDDAGTSDHTISLAANYKIALDSLTSLTTGLGYSMGESTYTSGDDETTADITSLAVIVGIERALSSNVVLTGEVDLYRLTTVEANDVEKESTGLFGNTRVGIAYLF